MKLEYCLFVFFIFAGVSTWSNYEYSESGTIRVVNGSSYIFSSTGYNITVYLANNYSSVPYVCIGISKYSGMDQMAQQSFCAKVVQVTITYFIVNLWQNPSTSTHVDNITISYIVIEDVYNNIILQNRELKGFQNVSIPNVGVKSDQVYINIPQIINKTTGNQSNIKIAIFLNGFYESSLTGYYLWLSSILLINETVLVTVKTLGDCLIKGLNITILIIDQSKFPSNIKILTNIQELNDNITSFSISNLNLNQTDIIYGIVGFQSNNSASNLNFQLVQSGSNITGSLSDLSIFISFFGIFQEDLTNQTLITNNTNTSNQSNTSAQNTTIINPPSNPSQINNDLKDSNYTLYIIIVVCVIIAVVSIVIIYLCFFCRRTKVANQKKSNQSSLLGNQTKSNQSNQSAKQTNSNKSSHLSQLDQEKAEEIQKKYSEGQLLLNTSKFQDSKVNLFQDEESQFSQHNQDPQLESLSRIY